MGYARIRSGGSVLYTKLKGAARAAGVSTAFGPQPAPSGGGGGTESVIWPLEPADTDNIDGSQSYNMGIKFSLTTGKNCVGVKWRVPDVISTNPAGGDHVASIWTVTGENRIASKVFTPVAGGYQNILFDSSVALTGGVSYVAAIYTAHYVYRSTTDAVVSPSGNLTVQEGRLVAYNGGSEIYPSSVYGSWYYISPIVEV